MTSFDPAFIENIRALTGDGLGDFLRAMDMPPALAFRVNVLRANALREAARYAEAPVPWARNCHYVKSGARPGAGPAHFAGALYVQEASAMLPAEVLNVRPGEKVLDLCAAPGGKTSQLAAMLENEGILVSNEPEPRRARMLAGNIERLGIQNSVVVSEYPDALAEKWPSFFDAVLVDAPCSGEGMFRREPAARDEWTAASPAGCAKRQIAILDHAARMVRPGGRMVYSTCTFNAIENEGVVEAFLAGHPDFYAVDFSAPGLPPSRGGMLRIMPHMARGDGQFAALLMRSDDAPVAAPRRERGKARPLKAADPSDAVLAFEDNFHPFPVGFRPALQGDMLVAIPELAPDTAGLKVISPGMLLARVVGRRLEPDHRCAMALEDLSGAELDDARALAFCRGEAVPCAGKGYLVARWHGMPLGWGKASDGILKNHLPKGLRRSIDPENI